MTNDFFVMGRKLPDSNLSVRCWGRMDEGRDISCRITLTNHALSMDLYESQFLLSSKGVWVLIGNSLMEQARREFPMTFPFDLLSTTVIEVLEESKRPIGLVLAKVVLAGLVSVISLEDVVSVVHELMAEDVQNT